VALCALQRGMRSIQSKAGTRMGKGRASPVRRVVALLARRRELRLRMVGTGRAVVIGLVALDASPIGDRVCPAGE